MGNLLVINPDHPQPRKIGQAVDMLERGGIIAYPTDTVYGFGCDLHNRKAVDKVYKIKNVPRTHLMSFVCPDLSGISRYAYVSDFAYRVLRRLLPGPYTVILQATPEVPRMLLQKRRTVGIRIPQSPITLDLVSKLGRPILSTSITDGDGEIMADPYDIKDRFGKNLDVVIDGGYLGNEASTVVSLVDDEVEVFREGKGSLEPLGL